jgi:general stress protein CsbA
MKIAMMMRAVLKIMWAERSVSKFVMLAFCVAEIQSALRGYTTGSVSVNQDITSMEITVGKLSAIQIKNAAWKRNAKIISAKMFAS